uniref:Transcriptional regulator n=1 Tax=Ascaris lumbricoides TaxID=6252 RepID=A0A0M3I3Y3_ASCLU
MPKIVVCDQLLIAVLADSEYEPFHTADLSNVIFIECHLPIK